MMIINNDNNCSAVPDNYNLKCDDKNLVCPLIIYDENDEIKLSSLVRTSLDLDLNHFFSFMKSWTMLLSFSSSTLNVVSLM